MGLEVATYIDGLVITNPVGATDPKSQGDDHIRLLKSTIKNTFPNIAAAVTPSAADLNTLLGHGAGAGMVADIGVLADPGADRVLGWDESANAAIAFALSTGLTTSTTNILIDTTVVPQLAAANTFSNNQNLFGDGAQNEYASGTPNVGIANDGACILAIRDTTNNVEGFIIAGTGSMQVGTRTAHPLVLYTNNGAVLTFDTSGNITPPNLAQAAGYLGAPITSTGVNYDTVATDTGKTIQITGSGLAIRIDDDVHPVGAIINFVMYGPSSTSATIALLNGSNMYLVGSNYGTTGTRTLASGGVATAFKHAANEWSISGIGIS